MTQNVSNKGIVLPGQLIGEGIYHDINCFKEGKDIFSYVQGTVRIEDSRIRVIPMSGVYIPKVDDLIIGVITGVSTGGCDVEINSPYIANMPKEEVLMNSRNRDINLSKYFSTGDIISAKIIHVDEVNSSVVSGPKKLDGGFIMEVDPKRIPRVIGKKKSMLNMIREKTGCTIVVGQNGRVWIKGRNTELVIDIIKKIEAEALTQGLTDKIGEILDRELGLNRLKNGK